MITYLAILLELTVIVLTIAVVSGLYSKKIAYSLGALGSALGASLAIIVLLSNSNISWSLWSITDSSFAEIAISPFNAYFLLISCIVWIGTCIYSLR